MVIEEQFNVIANEYDSKRGLFIPCFHDFYETTTNFIASNISAPKRILDLGAGTGLLSYVWYPHFPQADYVLVDLAEEMLEVAKKRFAGFPHISYEIADYSKELSHGTFDCIISALSIHHLDEEAKRTLFSSIYQTLPINGIFVNYDQFCGGTAKMNQWFDSYWMNQLENSELTANDIAQWKERRKLDKECSVEEEAAMLVQCKFREVKCVYSNQKFSVVIAVK